jgi:hypothetical protein
MRLRWDMGWAQWELRWPLALGEHKRSSSVPMETGSCVGATPFFGLSWIRRVSTAWRCLGCHGGHRCAYPSFGTRWMIFRPLPPSCSDHEQPRSSYRWVMMFPCPWGMSWHAACAIRIVLPWATYSGCEEVAIADDPRSRPMSPTINTTVGA